jgi:hypothetical protein
MSIKGDAAQFLIKIEEKGKVNIYTYWREDVLRCDIALNKPENYEVFKFVDDGFKFHYEKIELSKEIEK